MSAAPVSITTATATSPTTSTVRTRPPDPAWGLPCRSDVTRLTWELLIAGSTPNTMPVATETRAVKARTDEFTATADGPTAGGTSDASNVVPHAPTASPMT